MIAGHSGLRLVNDPGNRATASKNKWLVVNALVALFSPAAATGTSDTIDVSHRPITAMDLLTLQQIGGDSGTGLSVSPDGKFLAYETHQVVVAADTYRVTWFVAPLTGREQPINVGDGGDPTLFRSRMPSGRIVGAWISHYAKWSPDSRGIAYRKKVDGATQIWWGTRDGGEREALTENAADVIDFEWSRDGSEIYFSTDAPRAAIKEAEASGCRSGFVFDYETDWSTLEGKPIVPPFSLLGGRARVWVLDVATRNERVATADEIAEFDRLKAPPAPRSAPSKARQIVLTADETSIAWVQPDDPEKQGWKPPMTLYAASADSGQNPIRCAAPECTGVFDLTKPLRDGLQWHTVGNEILFVRKEGAAYSKRSLYGWQIGQDQVRKVLTTDEWISDCLVAGGNAICFRETPTYPRTVVSIDLANGRVETLVDPNPHFAGIQLGDVDLLEWKSALGHETFGYLIKPPDYNPGRRYPLVFVGYRARTALRGGVGNEYPVHLLAANGFIVLVYDKPKLFDAYEKHADIIDVGRQMWRPDLFDVRSSLASFEAAIELLDERGLIDADRVAVTGLSAGVGDVSYALINSDLFAAAITSSIEWAPSVIYLSGFAGESIKDYRKAIGAGRYGTSDGILWEHLSLGLNATRVSTPLLVNSSDHEHIRALEEVTALIESGKPVEMVVHPDEYHIKWHPLHRLAIYERNLDWLNFWLKGLEDSDSRKRDQFRRWRRLRGQDHRRAAPP